MRRREFLRAGAVAAGLPRAMPALLWRRAGGLLVPMDDSQAQHLKAYGVAWRVLDRGGRAEWLLNYRGGAFLLPAEAEVERDAALAGVTAERVDGAGDSAIRATIAESNADAIPLEKAPKMAVYVPPNAAPWDDAVTMALEYAGIRYEKLWDDAQRP